MDSALRRILSSLESLENSQMFTDVIASIEDEIETLKWELRFLITFYKFIARDDCFDAILFWFEVPIIYAGNELVSLSYQSLGEVGASLKNVVCNMLDKIKPIMPAAADCYGRASPSSLNDDLLVEFLDDVMKDFEDLLISRARSSRVPNSVKPQVEALHEKLRFLRYFLYFVSKRGVAHEEMKDLLNHTQTVAVEAACLFYSLVEKMWPEKDCDMNLWCSNLLGKIGLTKPDVRPIYIQVLKDSSSSGSSVVPPVRDDQVIADSVGFLLDFLPQLLNYVKADYITALRFELRFLVILLTDFPKQGSDLAENSNNILRSIEEVATESGYVIFSLFVNEMMKEDIYRQMDLKLSDLVEKVKLLKAETKMRLPSLSTVSRHKFPKTGGLEIIEFLVGNLNELLCSQADLIVTIKHEIKTVGRELESLAADMEKQRNDTEGMSNLWTQMLDVAYWAEYVIDSFVAKDNPEWYCILWLHCVVDEIKEIKAQLKEINMKNADELCVLDVVHPISNALPSQSNVASDGKLVVGFIPETEKLLQRLERGPKHRDIVSIVGMSGLGKSTLAKKLYEHPSVTSQFKCIWCYVSPVYEKGKLLHEILRYLVDPKDIDQKSDEADLALMVYQNLKRKKYLIVLDDVWDIKVWNDLRMSFPINDNNGSRVMLTTQLLDVAKADRNYLPLRSFDDEESWDLFNQIVFKPKRYYSSELEKIGKKIVVSCRGIPLAVSLIAGLLVNTEKKEDWEQLEKNLISRVADNRIALCTRIAGLSYKHLPNHLKSCFLYFGAFKENPEVPVQRLIWLWIAEGFVRKSKTKSLEEAAEGYLNELISRSLVKIAKFKSKGGVKSCQVHDLVRDFCSAKAEEENVLKLVNRPNSDESAYKHHGTTYGHYRLCIYSELGQFVRSSPSVRSARTLLYFGASGTFLDKFKLLRVLDMELFNVGDFPTGLELLVHLRYLAMRVATNTIPPSLSDLCYLETIIIKGNRGEIVLPDTIWKMAKLRHLHINARATFGSNNQGEENYEDSQLLLNDLQTISTPRLQYGENSEKMLRKIRNVRKMRCIFLDSWGVIGYRKARRMCNRFPKLEILSQLESLKVFYHGKRLHPCEFSFPSNLKKLTLSKFRLPWKEISTIGKLLNLKVLKLRFKAFEGPRWDMIDGEFENLEYLELENLDISEWNASSDPLPSLRKLILKRCKQLKEVPFSFGDIRMLERIDVQWCSRSATDSVLQIRQDQKEQGNEEIHFSILPLDWDSIESSSEER